jgi:cohesin complex subunit SA-1/2
LQEKEHTTMRQLQAATTTKSDGKKVEGLRYNLQRSRQDLEEIVASTFTTVFLNRYRDSNPFIRVENIAALSEMTLLRPDIYLSDKYLKYIGWTLSDKVACVRVASLAALAAPFQERNTNLTSMENVIRKFLPRLADCTIDVDVSVQEKAMALFLRLDRANLLEDFEDDALWAQINNRALASDTSHAVRRDALQFVLDQLEAFDYDEDEAARSKTWAKKKSASIVQSSNKTAAKQLATLAGWYVTGLTVWDRIWHGIHWLLFIHSLTHGMSF